MKSTNKLLLRDLLHATVGVILGVVATVVIGMPNSTSIEADQCYSHYLNPVDTETSTYAKVLHVVDDGPYGDEVYYLIIEEHDDGEWAKGRNYEDFKKRYPKKINCKVYDFLLAKNRAEK